MDFLILLPIHMDINRNKRLYLEKDNQRIDSFVGTSEWRSDWEKAVKKKRIYGCFFYEILPNAHGKTWVFLWRLFREIL